MSLIKEWPKSCVHSVLPVAQRVAADDERVQVRLGVDRREDGVARDRRASDERRVESRDAVDRLAGVRVAIVARGRREDVGNSCENMSGRPWKPKFNPSKYKRTKHELIN